VVPALRRARRVGSPREMGHPRCGPPADTLMDWKEYEGAIEAHFREEYPLARIKANAKLPGKFSRTDRQIDLLIEEDIVDYWFRIVVDGKYRNRKLDVKDVEEFLGLVRDVGGHKGIMISTEGYTEAAIKRAYSDELVLDVLNFKELKQNHGACGIPYSGPNCAVVQPPMGWIVDATQGRGALAWLYQRGLTYEQASAAREIMYVKFWRKEGPFPDLDSLLNHQEEYMRGKKENPPTRIEIIGGVRRTDARTLIRIARFQHHPGLLECTGFVDFDTFIFMCVLFTQDELAEKNLSKLRFVMRKVFRMYVTHGKAPEAAKEAGAQPKQLPPAAGGSD
jgi:hypothetical protein